MLFRALLFRSLLLAACLTPAALYAQDGKPVKLQAPKPDPNQVRDWAQDPAVPVGGTEAYNIYLTDHLTYPTSAVEKRIQGVDTVEFVVEKNGTLSDVHIRQGFDPACDAEAVRVIKAGPKWQPGKHLGQTIRQRVLVPVMFSLPAEPAPAAASTASAAGTTSATGTPPPAAGQPGSTTASGMQLVQPESTATPPGGTDAFFAWLKSNMQYPAQARKFNREGKIRVEFMVETDGSLTNAKPLNRLGFGMDEEALRLIKTAPKWQPAMYQGKPIRQKMVIPVIFQL